MKRDAGFVLWHSVLLGLILNAVAFLSALAPGPDSVIDHFYRPAVWAVELFCGGRALSGLRPLAFFFFCSSQNALSVALILMPLSRAPLGAAKRL